MSQGATNYYWNFCTANINQPPIGTNLGNVGGSLSKPVYMDYVYTNGNYYGFVTNNFPGGLLRLDFGNSLLNTPVVTSLGNIGGSIPNTTEGVQIANDNGNWYVLIVGGNTLNATPSLITVSLGTNIANNSPIATNWGNIGNLSYPHDLYVFKDNGHWYGLTVNYANNTVTRFDLTVSLSNTPTALNLGNVGNLNGPTGIQAILDNGNWRVFVTNATSSTLSRLDFGSSLLNTPTGVNLGNPNNAFVTCWDIYVLKYCGESEAFVINANGSYDLIKLDFGNSLLNTPTAVSLGNQGNMNFPHSISKLFRVGPDVYSFVTNVNNNTLTLLEFPGCTNASIPNSTVQNPGSITYNSPGTYNINLTVDDGLPTQTSYCKQIVVQDLNITKSKDTSICAGTNVQLTAGGGKTYSWLPTSTLNIPNASNPIASPSTSTKYYVTVSNAAGCSKKDSIKITVNNVPVISKSNDTSICKNSQVMLLANGGLSYSWSPVSSLNNFNIANPIATPPTNTTYLVKVTNGNGCSKTDSVKIMIRPVPIITKSNDTTVCKNTPVKIFIEGGSSYLWSPSSSLDNPSSPTPIASPLLTTLYHVAITYAQFCTYNDSVKISVRPPVVFSVSPNKSICAGSTQSLSASGGTSYLWSPASFLDNPNISNPIANPDTSVIYSVTIKENICNESATLYTNITVFPLPNVQASKSNDITCALPSSHLMASGAQNFIWAPSDNLNNAGVSNPTATPAVTTLYTVTGKDLNGCSNTDTISVSVAFNINALYGLPNSFTPNGDGLNDCFGVKYWGQVSELDFNIYNRFGERVFHSNNSASCWDGKYKGQLQDPDIFVYIIKAKTACGYIDKKGTVLLLK
ncbi:MAG: gliding motility-associated C-terminal domain-containing protein [Bacteroidota bacterium]|nr:gliding motility-associated C-terminal domain-containing protein [Bacteroidota bacterium]